MSEPNQPWRATKARGDRSDGQHVAATGSCAGGDRLGVGPTKPGGLPPTRQAAYSELTPRLQIPNGLRP